MKELINIITINDFNYSQGGASKVAIDTANMLAIAGYNSIFVSAVADDEKSTLSNMVTQYKFRGTEFLHYRNKVKGMWNGIKCNAFSKYIGEVLSNFDPDNTLVHVHGWTKACSSDFFNVLRLKGFTTYLTMHEYFCFCPNGAYFNFKRNRACNKRGCSLNCLICNCDSRNYFFKVYRYIRELRYRHDMKFQYINVIYISEFERNIIENQINTPHMSIIPNPVPPICEDVDQKEYDYIYVGRTTKEKGVDLFVKLAEELNHKKFLIVGEYNTSIKNLKSTGWVSEKEVDQYLKKSSKLVFPSLWPETFGLNVMKALEAGIPCLVSSNTAAEKYVINGKNGYIFKQGDFSSLKAVAEMKISGKKIEKKETRNYLNDLTTLWKQNCNE